MKKLVLVGSIGNGKSSCGNFILEDNVFTTDSSKNSKINRITNEIKIVSNNEFLIIDCPGFNNSFDEIFYDEFLKNKDKIKDKIIDGFILVTKFDDKKSDTFFKDSQEFKETFGTLSIKSLMILCIQVNTKNANDEFDKIIKQSDGYIYLQSLNNNQEIPYCLWDNISSYPNQKNKLMECLSKLEKFDSIKLIYSFDLIENKIKTIKERPIENENKLLKKMILIGSIGNGKSTTGNKLLNSHAFTVGNDLNRITTEIKSAQNNNRLIVDCPGFGDASDATIFANEFLKYRYPFLAVCPINAFILVIKFENGESLSFLKTAKEFFSSFETEGIESLMLICIQNEKKKYSDDQFKNLLFNSDGYKYLKEKNNKKEIPYCLWDNFNPYPNQESNFESCLEKLKPFDDVTLQYSFDRIEIELEY